MAKCLALCAAFMLFATGAHAFSLYEILKIDEEMLQIRKAAQEHGLLLSTDDNSSMAWLEEETTVLRRHFHWPSGNVMQSCVEMIWWNHKAPATSIWGHDCKPHLTERAVMFKLIIDTEEFRVGRESLLAASVQKHVSK